ncbi:hypothetical protein T07_2299, partial [Trichinella nelsoni]
MFTLLDSIHFYRTLDYQVQIMLGCLVYCDSPHFESESRRTNSGRVKLCGILLDQSSTK